MACIGFGFVLFCFFENPWVLHLLYHLLFRIDVGLFCGLALLQNFFFPDFSSNIFLVFF